MPNEPLPPHDGPETPPTEPETAKQKFERERLTRRQALKKFGMTSAMATFALFSVDDLARMVGGAMERQAKNSKIAAQVAEEFQHAGVALGAVVSTPYYPSYPYYYSITACQQCGITKDKGYAAAKARLDACTNNCPPVDPSLPPGDPCGCAYQYKLDRQAALDTAITCCRNNNCDCGPYAYPSLIAAAIHPTAWEPLV